MNHSNRGRLTVQIDGPWRLYTTTVPKGGRALGTVTRDGLDTGALVLIEATGLYIQVNVGVIRSLDQRKVKVALAASGTETD